MESSNEHEAPWDCVFSKDEGDNCRQGKTPASDREYFEILCLCILQAGLNWASIRKHWTRYREGFFLFDIGKLSRVEPPELLERPGVIKNSRKVEAIVHNAKEFQLLKREYGSFGGFLDSLRPHTEPEQLKSLAARFRQVGPETAAYFLHAVGFPG